MEQKMQIKKAMIVIVKNTPDKVYLYTNLPCPFNTNRELVISFETSSGSGEEYVRENFNIQPEVIKRM